MNHETLSANLEGEPPSASQGSADHSASTTTAFRSRTTKHLTFLSSLLASLDILFFVELIVVYYLDARLSAFLLRALAQVLIISPRVPSSFQPPASVDPLSSPIIGILFSTNFICLFIHLISNGPIAGEVTQFYNYGGIFVDFVGEKTPVPKVKLILLDCLIFIIQLLMLSAMIEKAELSKSTEAVANMRGTQDIDAEERGVTAVSEDHPSSPLESSQEVKRILESPHAHPLDSFTTGRHVIADLNLSTTVRRQWRLWKQGPPSSSTSADSTATGGSSSSQENTGFTTLVGPFGFRVRVGGRTAGR